MQTFENLHLQNCSTEFLDSANKYYLGMCNKSCSNGGNKYIMSETTVKENLNK